MDVMRHHGPMFVIGSVLIVSGIQLLAIGLLGELQVRHFYASRQRTPYAIDRMVRLRAPQEPNILSETLRTEIRGQGTGISKSPAWGLSWAGLELFGSSANSGQRHNLHSKILAPEPPQGSS
jgi:hypothetical protein